MPSRPPSETPAVPPRTADVKNAYASYALSFVFSALVALLVPIVPLLALRMGASQFEIGIIGSAGPLCYVPLALLSGVLADKFRRKGLLVMSSCLYAVTCAIYSTASAPLHLIAGRLMDGISAAMLWPAVEALLADSANVSGDKMVSNFGVLWSSGSLVGGLASSVVLWFGDYEIVFIPCAVVSLLMGLLSVILISEGNRPQNKPRGEAQDNSSTPKRMTSTWSMAALYSFCQGTIFSLYPAYAQLKGVPGAMIGLTITLLLAGRTITFYLYRFVKQNFRSLALAGALMASLFSLMLIFSTEPFLLLPCGLLLGVGVGLCYSAAIRSALEADPSSRGTYAGLFEGSIGLGYLLGAGIGGLAAEFVLEGPYVMSSVVALSASALLAKDWGGTE